MVDELLLEQMADFTRCVLERDRQLAESVLDPDYALVLVHPTSAKLPRNVWLETLPEYIVHTWDVEEQTIDVDGDVATVLQRIHMEASVLGVDRSGLFVLTDTWRQRDDGWRIWRRHSTPLSAGVMPERP